MRIGSEWWYRQNFTMPMPSLRLSCPWRETCCEITSRKFAEHLKDQILTKLCSDAGFLKDIGKGQFFITLEDEGPDDVQTSCREYTLLRDQETSRARGWIRGKTKIGTVFDVKVYFHQGRYGIDVMIESLFRDRTVSWVRSVNGSNKYVTETSEEIPVESIEHRVTREPVANARPRPKPAVTLSPISIPLRERKWIDINPERFRQDCFAVSKSHDQITAKWSINSSRR